MELRKTGEIVSTQWVDSSCCFVSAVWNYDALDEHFIIALFDSWF